MSAPTSLASPAARKMDDIYRLQRFIYDPSRRFFLLGRLRLLRQLDAAARMNVLEIGCGTGWNLLKASSLYPRAQFFGLDISAAMLRTARRSLRKAGKSTQIELAAGDATDFDPVTLFGVRSFDRIFVSYALSMIPDWKAVLDRAERLLAPRGSLHIVDFGDCAGLPHIVRKILYAWLTGFSVVPVADFKSELVAFSKQRGLEVCVKHLHGRYAVHAVLRKRSRLEL